jgi:hypothetical protein
VTNYHDPAWTEESRFRGALDDVIIIPLVFVTLAANKILRFILAILMRLLDYAFPLAMQIVRLPLFAAKVVGNVIVTVINGALRFFPLSETANGKKTRRMAVPSESGPAATSTAAPATFQENKPLPGSAARVRVVKWAITAGLATRLIS